MKSWKILFYILGLIPLGFIISLLSFYFHAGRILGNLPRYNQPDPKELEIYSEYSPYIDLSGEVWIYSLLMWIISTILYLILKRRQISWTPVIVSTFGQACAIVLFLSGIMEWYAD